MKWKPEREENSVKINALLNEDMVIPEILAREKDSALREIVRYLKSKDKVKKDQELYERLIQRERLGSTAIGDGVAIPHCKLKEVESPLVALAISRKGVSFDALDGKPTHLIFLVVSSPDNPSQNLQTLAAIAHLVRKAGSLPKKILAAKNPKRILEIVREEEEKLEE